MVSFELTDVSIRPGVRTDAPAVFQLIQPFVEAQLLLDRTEPQIAELTRHSAVVEQSGQLVGFAAVEIYSQRLAEIQCLAVHANCHLSGIGKQLVSACVKIAADHGVHELMAISSSEEFFRQCGFDYSLPQQKRAFFIAPTL